MKKTALVLITITFYTFITANAQELVQSFIETNTTGYSQFGSSVSYASDLNNDGYDDIIVGAPLFDSNGSCFIYFGGEVMDSIPDIVITGKTVNSRLGTTVSGIGDVNNDGYDDIIVGAISYADVGAAYIYYGGTSMDNIADVIIIGEEYEARFTSSLSGAGDINSDGFDDVIIGAWGIDKSYIYYGGSNMDSIADVTLNGDSTYSYTSFGYSVSAAGDVNNDGYDDIIIGSSQYDYDTGRAYIYFGGSEFDTIPDIIMEGESSYDDFGTSVSDVGDVNGDGYDDVIIGANNWNSYIGKSYIFYGGTNMDSIPDVEFIGEETNSGFGWSVSGAGDINNDGFKDVIVGSYYYNNRQGRSYIYFGGTNMDATADITLDAELSGSEFGCSVSNAGDLNMDGFDDVIVGAKLFKSYTGRSYIYLGNNSPNDSVDIILTGIPSGLCFGYSVSDAGDVNNDGFDDIIVGAPGYNINNGRAYIYFGGNNLDSVPSVTLSGQNYESFGCSVSGIGDVNNDGFDDIIVGAKDYNRIGRAYIYFGRSNMNENPDIILMGTEGYEYFGKSLSKLDDINNDGFNDVIIGASGYNSGTGRCLIYLGGSLMDSIPDIIINGESEGDNFGESVSSVGDINSDGISDIIIGAPGFNSGSGRSYVYLGRTNFNSTPDLILNGEEMNNYFGISVSGAGDINSDGFDDIIVGAIGHNSFTGRSYIYLGDSILNDTPYIILSGENNSDQFGWSVSEIEDFNDDGYDDIIIGARFYDSKKGKSYIFNGGESITDSLPIILIGESINNYYGNSVSFAGDVNNDGGLDIIIGAPYFQSNGKAYVYSNKLKLKVASDSITILSHNKVIAHGSFISLGSETITSHGFCWNTIGLPDINDSVVNIGGANEVGTFTSSITDLKIGQKYFLRAFATNADETNYGDVISFSLDYNQIKSSNYFSQEFILFPNPADEYMQINWEGSDINKINFKIYNLLGHMIMSRSSYEKNSKIFMTNVAQGIYLFEIQAMDKKQFLYLYKK